MKTLPFLLVGLAAVLPASAVVVTTAPANTTAPLTNPYFGNVGQYNGASVIYLGNGWVMTADHVAPAEPVGASVAFGGTFYSAQPGSWQQLNNPAVPGLTAQTDIVLFRLSSDPGLAALTLKTTPATTGDGIMMMGNGRIQENTLTNWNVTTVPGPNNDVWVEGGTPTTDSGYKTTATHAVSWGENVVTAGNVNAFTGIYNVISYYTTFDQTGGVTNEAQGVNGDSGGADFYFNGTSWLLSGMTHAVSTLENQPTVSGIGGSTAVYGDLTVMADLSYYAPQITTIVAVPESSCAALLLASGAFFMRRRR